MSPHAPFPMLHRSGRAGWLCAAVLGANDGIVSVSGLVVGVAGVVASALAMAAAAIVGRLFHVSA